MSAREVWKPIPGYDGYEASSLGRVRSFLGRGPRPKRVAVPMILAAARTTRGYLRACLGRRKMRFVHRLVLEAFVGPCPPGMECCHNNGDPADNRVDNLRWDTKQANSADARTHGTLVRGERQWRSRLTEADVLQIKTHLGWLPQRHLASVFAVREDVVSKIARGDSWTHITSGAER